MRLTTSSGLLALVSTLFTAFSPIAGAAPADRYKAGFSGYTASADVGWQEDSNCAYGNYAYLGSSENTYKIRGNGKPDPNTYESAYFYATILTECTAESAVLSYLSLDAWGGDDDPQASVTVDSKLSTGTVSVTGTGSVYSELCLLSVYEDDGYEEYYYTNCTELLYENQTLSVQTQLTGQGSSYTGHSSYSDHSRYGTYRSRSTGTTRDAVVVSMTLTLEDNSIVDIPTGSGASYSYGSLGKSKGGEASFYRYE